MTTKRKETFIYILPLFVILCIHPLFMRLYQYDNGLESYAWNAESGNSSDLFLHEKMILFEIVCISCIAMLLIYLFRTEAQICLPKIFLLLVGYAVLALISTLVSEYRQFGFSGIDEQFENVWCLLGYALIMVYIYIVVQDFKHIRILMYGLLVSALVIGVIGASQFLGHDLLLTDLAKSLYIPSALRNLGVNLNLGFGTVYMTLYNPGYVGLYTSLVCPILLVLFFYEEKKSVRILSLAAFILLVIGAIGARTAAGYIGLGATFATLLVLMFKNIIQTHKFILYTLLGMVLLGIFVFGIYTFQQYWTAKNEDITSTQPVTGYVLETSDESLPSDTVSTEDYPLTSITETDDYVEFCYDGITFRETMYVENNMVYMDFTDVAGNPIAFDYDELSMTYTLTESGLEGITSYSATLLDEYIGFVTTIDGKSWVFTYTYKDDVLSYYTINPLGNLDKDITSESAVFTDHYGLFSGRGYIWAKTIPLLKKYILLGSGADSFTLVFPQSDYVSAYKGGYENMIVSKPHCLYLQIAIQTGLVSLILLLAFYLWYFVKSLKLYFCKKVQSQEQALAIAIFAGTIGFLVVSLINDSSICTTPVFVVLLGLGIVLNRINEMNMKQKHPCDNRKGV